MTAFLQQTLDDKAQAAPHWMQALRARGRERWSDTTLPTRRMESWKYTSLNGLRDDYRPVAPGESSEQVLPARLAAGFGGVRVVFVDGVFQPTLSSSQLPDGVRLCRFSEADESQAQRIGEHLDSLLDADAQGPGSAAAGDPHPFAVHNSASLVDGVFLEIDDDASVAEPIEFVWLVQAGAHATLTNQRLLLLAGKNSRSTVVEHFAALDSAGPAFTNGISELLLGEGARVNHYRLHEEDGEAVHVGGVHARLDSNAHLDSFHLALGSRMKRLDVVVHHAGPGAHADLNGVYLPRGEEHIDYHTTIEHAVGHCTTDEVFRGIIADRARAVFNGRIHIHPKAQKTRAELSNKNLLTSTEAEVDTKPELEIYADDVQCAHGATVAQIDALSLHYLRTRGLSRGEAEFMLSFGFINELVEAISLETVRDYLRTLLAARFERETAPVGDGS